MFLQNCFTGIKDKFAESGKNIEVDRIWDKPNSRKKKKVGMLGWPHPLASARYYGEGGLAGHGRLGLGAVKGWSVDEPCTHRLPDERGSKERQAADLARDFGMARQRIQAWGRKAAEDGR